MFTEPAISTILAFGLPGGSEWIILLVLGLIIFGRRLPEVGRSLGKSIVEFKRGIKGIEDEIDDGVLPRPSPPPDRSRRTIAPPWAPPRWSAPPRRHSIDKVLKRSVLREIRRPHYVWRRCRCTFGPTAQIGYCHA